MLGVGETEADVPAPEEEEEEEAAVETPLSALRSSCRKREKMVSCLNCF